MSRTSCKIRQVRSRSAAPVPFAAEPHQDSAVTLALMAGLGFIAWNADSRVVLWVAYVGLGYMWMGMVTFMHDAPALHAVPQPRGQLGVRHAVHAADLRDLRGFSRRPCRAPSPQTGSAARSRCFHDGPSRRARLPAVLCLCHGGWRAEFHLLQFHLSGEELRAAAVGDPGVRARHEGAGVLAGAGAGRRGTACWTRHSACCCGRCWCWRC